MKTIVLMLMSICTISISHAQTDSMDIIIPDSSIIEIDEETDELDELKEFAGENEKTKNDTTKLRVGKKSISIIDDEGETYIKVMDSKDDKEQNFDFEIEDDEMQLKKKKKDRKFEGHYAGLEVGLNNYGLDFISTNLNNDLQFMKLYTSKSYNVNLNPVQYSIPLFSKYMGLVTGLGFNFNSYWFDNNNSIIKDSTGIIAPKYFNNGETAEYSKLKTTYLSCPLMLEFQIPTSHKKNKPIHISGGIIAGLKIGAKTKYKISGSSEKTKLPGNYNLSPYRLGLTARVGYRALNLYANMYFTEMFEDYNNTNYGIPNNPRLYPFSVGLVLIPFD